MKETEKIGEDSADLELVEVVQIAEPID
jgi:hypothetical protein